MKNLSLHSFDSSKIFNLGNLLKALVALIFAYFSLVKDFDAEINLPTLNKSTLMLKTYLLVFIFFAYEESKNLLLAEKSAKRLEWSLANGISMKEILLKAQLELFIITSMITLPLPLMIALKEGLSLAGLVEYYLFAFIFCIIINAGILYLKNLNRHKLLLLFCTLLYFLLFVAEIAMLLAGVARPVISAVKLTLLLLIALSIIKKCNKERITISYY